LSSAQSWPSRRLQIAIAVVLAIGAVLTVFVPPFGKERRARQLYEDAWYGDFDQVGSRYSDKSVRLLEKALKLSPGNSLYEQALVWHSPSNELPKLIKERKLGPDATRLAYGLIYTSAHLSLDGPTSKYNDERLGRALILTKVDSKNSIAHYYAAGCLVNAKRLPEAYASVVAGNSLGKGRFYDAETTESIADSVASPQIQSLDFQLPAVVQSAARGMGELGNSRLRAGDVKGACDVFEACCRMGTNFALSEPRSIIRFLVGKAIFAIGWKSLRPVCKDFGMKETFDQYSKVDKESDRGLAVVRNAIKNNDLDEVERAMLIRFSMPFTAVAGFGAAILLEVYLLLWWSISKIIARRRKQETLSISPWGEGSLARLFLAVYLPAFAILMIFVAFVSPHIHMELDTTGIWFEVAFGAAVQLVILGVMLKRLRRAFNESTGERVGMGRFIFRGPANRQAWSSKWLLGGVGAQAAFLLCVGLLMVILYKPIFGVQPWQYSRIPYKFMQKETATVNQIDADLAKACPASWHLDK